MLVFFSSLGERCQLRRRAEQQVHVGLGVERGQRDAQARRTLGHGGQANGRDPEAALSMLPMRLIQPVACWNKGWLVTGSVLHSSFTHGSTGGS